MPRLIVAIIDTLTNEIAQQAIIIVKHPTAAIRMFNDVMGSENAVSQHPDDHELWQMAEIDDDTLEVIPKKEILITGKQYNAQRAKEQK